MEYAQEAIATLHDLAGRVPNAPFDRTAVVVPMTQREYGRQPAEDVLSELAAVQPAEVIVALRADPDRVGSFREWLDGFDLPLTTLWCNGPEIEGLLADHGLDGPAGKGRDVWLGLGIATAAAEFVALQDADAKGYDRADLARLLWPLSADFSFSKGYYARVENGRLYGRLCRLFYEPVVRAVANHHDAPIVAYLGAFRYALAGEVAMTATLARRVRVPRQWGLEVGVLGDAFDHVGFAGTAQVDLGTHEHDHRPVRGTTGLSDMSRDVGATLFGVLETHGVDPDYDTLPDRYREVARRLIRQYAADAAINGLSYDLTSERKQVETYAAAIGPPKGDDRLPRWEGADLSPGEVRAAAEQDLIEYAGCPGRV